MNLPLATEHREKVGEFQRKHHTRLVALLFTDIVGSTELKQSLGDLEGGVVIQQHHAAVRNVLSWFPEGEEISTAGDSFFIVFSKPSDAVKFALQLQSRLRGPLPKVTGRRILDRIGIHVGEVVVEDTGATAKPHDIYGLQINLCARVMELAQGDQILLTRAAFDNARQILKGQDIEGTGALSWLNHGTYKVKGVDDSVEICEAGEEGKAALKSPPESETGRRYMQADGELVLGWRPAASVVVPKTKWILEKKLGEGGFGEVWLGRHEKLKEQRVFKFCFRADRVRSLKREVTIFRVLKQHVGHHPNIVGVQDVYFDEPPFYLVMDYGEGKDLPKWIADQGGIANVPVSTRLEIAAQVADALQAAHAAGVIHRDVKPSNILVTNQSQSRSSSPKSQLNVKLTDFGIGQVVSQEVLAGLTSGGFTQPAMLSSAPDIGTFLYMAPEVLAGKAASPASDIYSLGVVLYQMLIEDFTRPMAPDWAKGFADPLLRQDLEACFAGDPRERLASAAQMSQGLRSYDARRAAFTRKEAVLAVRQKAAHRRRLLQKWSVALLMGTMIGLLIFGFRLSRYGNIVITSYPSGAALLENGQRIGTTPYRANNIRAGKLNYRVELEGYEPCPLTPEVGAKVTTEWTAVLRKIGSPEPADAGLSRADIRILFLQGAVELRPAGAKFWVLAQTNLVLHVGDRVRTGPNSRVVLRWLDQSVVNIGQQTEVQVLGPGKEIKVISRNAVAVVKG